MISISIPGQGDLAIQHVVFDFNGTLAVDGKLAEKTRILLRQLKEVAQIHILTADTYGTVQAECRDLGMIVTKLNTGLAAPKKAAVVKQLGGESVCCVGNGVNDAQMFQESRLAIVNLGEEGCAMKAFECADIVVRNIDDAILMLLKPDRLVATLRG